MPDVREGDTHDDTGTGLEAEFEVEFEAEFAKTEPPFPFRTHQGRALDEIHRLMVNGERRRAWVVLPPGTGKTLVGLETIRRLGAQAVVFGPNSAIQGQWATQWRTFRPATIPVGVDRSLATPVTALTYQSLATFDPDAEVDEEGHERLAGTGRRKTGALLDRLHPNGRALVETLRTVEPLTLVLDECHHLLEVWGQLVAELLDLVPHAYVLGLTATPPQSLTRQQVELVDELFGHPVYGTSIPAVVREGNLAPFAELAWLTTPTHVETDWLATQNERFTELTTDLTDPAFGRTPFLEWLDRRLVDRLPAIPWHRLALDSTDLANAGLRMHHAGLLALPGGARLAEEHRHAPTAEDWVTLLQDWLRHCVLGSEDPADQAVLDEIRRALPSVGYQLTKRGIRVGRSPVDRVMARSGAKTYAAAEIVAAEHGNLGDRLRMLILCDHERAAATLPATLHGVLAAEAGSARLTLETLVADERTAGLGPMLVTGKTVAAGTATAAAFRTWVTERAPAVEPEAGEPDEAGVVEISGRWSSRVWVPLVTSFFEAGGTRVLVGTRGLLGEGWDARRVSGLVDLTTATTPTAVVQTRGRALRVDPSWPEKVAVTWTVVCVTEDHPKGTSDWERFVRKHQGYFGIDETGEIVDGVAHVDHTFSPYAPPKVADFDTVNTGMLTRAEDRPSIRDLWRVGEPYDDRPTQTLRVRRTATDPARELVATAPEPPAAVSGPEGVLPRPEPPRHPVLRPGAVWLGIGLVLLILGLVWPGLVAACVGVAVTGVLLGRRRATARAAGRLVAVAATAPDPVRIAYAVADGLHAAELAPIGASAVTARVDADGEYRIALTGTDIEVSERFATALDEALSPIAAPRYVIPRYVLPRPADRQDELRFGNAVLDGELRPEAVVWHAVPTALGVNAGLANAYADAWRRWVSAGVPLYTGSPDGEAILATHRGSDPLDATTALRLAWE